MSWRVCVSCDRDVSGEGRLGVHDDVRTVYENGSEWNFLASR